MTLHDLKNNRERIIKNIGKTRYAAKDVMGRMAIWIENAPMYMSMKPTMKNIDKMTQDAISMVRNADETPYTSYETMGERNLRFSMQNLPSSMRNS